jgi:hypothetical protein
MTESTIEEQKDWDYSKIQDHYKKKLLEIPQNIWFTTSDQFSRNEQLGEEYTKSMMRLNEMMHKSYLSDFHDEFYLILLKEVKRRCKECVEDVTPQRVQEIFLDILQHADERDPGGQRRYPKMVDRWRHLELIHSFDMCKDCRGPACNHTAPLGEDDVEVFRWDHRLKEDRTNQTFYQSIFDDALLCRRCYAQYPRWDGATPLVNLEHDVNDAVSDAASENAASDSTDSDFDSDVDESEDRDYPFEDRSLQPHASSPSQYDPKWEVCSIYPSIMEDLLELFTKEQRMQLAATEAPGLAAEIEDTKDVAFERIPFVGKEVQYGYGYHNIRSNIVQDIRKDFGPKGRLAKGQRYKYEIVPKVTHDRCFHVNIFHIRNFEANDAHQRLLRILEKEKK